MFGRSREMKIVEEKCSLFFSLLVKPSSLTLVIFSPPLFKILLDISIHLARNVRSLHDIRESESIHVKNDWDVVHVSEHSRFAYSVALQKCVSPV